MEPQSKKTNPSGGFGLTLIIVGLVILAGNMGFIPQALKDVLFRWPMIFVVIAVIILLKGELKRGLIFLAIGAFFMAPHLIPGISRADIWTYWPILLILAGLLFLTERHRQFRPSKSQAGLKNDLINETVIFGGNVALIESQNFKGGTITSIFGGSELNFTGSKLSEQGAEIEVTALFGGSKMVVPKEWNIKIEVTSIFGGVSDKRLQTTREANAGTLTIRGIALFGGGEITSY